MTPQPTAGLTGVLVLVRSNNMKENADEDGGDTYRPKLQKRLLKGHSKQVTCVAHSSERASPDDTSPQHHPSLLLSGSEDGTARLWDLRTRKTSICMVIPQNGVDSNEITSVSFHPSRNDSDNPGDSQPGGSSSLLPLLRDCTVFLATTNKVYGYDLRHHSNVDISPIVREPHFHLTESFQCTDEVNELSFSYPGKRGSFQMAAADDAGEVHVVDRVPMKYELTPQCEKKASVLVHAEPETLGIASCVAFRPRSNGDHLASAGTDCTVKLWDVSRPKRPTSTVRIKPDAENSNQVCNPPYIHSLGWSHSGRLLAGAVGDGSIAILGVEGRRLVEMGRLTGDQGGHRSAVAAVCFPGFGLSRDHKVSSKTRKNGEAEDRLLISAGNDGVLNWWDLGANMVGSGPLDPVQYLPLEEKGECETKPREQLIDDDFGDEDLIPSPPRVLFQIQHGRKPNWITCNKAADGALPNSLFVADTSPNISIYTLPI